jgi:pyruvate kinase
MDYEIIATLGPASRTAAAWAEMLDAGASAFRLNTSHLSLNDLDEWLEKIAAFFDQRPARVPLVLDLQGSKWRLGEFNPFVLSEGQPVTLIHAASETHPGVLPVPHADFFHAAPLSDGEIVLNDAKIRLRVEALGEQRVQARVTLGGPLAPHKGITFAASSYRSEAFSAKDQAILERARGREGIRFAISYVRDAVEMARYRALFRQPGAHPAYLIAKLERGPAMGEAAQIAASADELWVCRGDLGAELGLPGMAMAVRAFSQSAARLPVPAIMAGQVLEHMTAEPTPTRSEVCYLHDTLESGYRGFVLSDETAIGRYPVEACRAAGMFRG